MNAGLLNVSLPRHFYALVRSEYLTDRQVAGELWPCCVFGASSQGGRALGLHVMVESGVVYWPAPPHSLAWKPDAPAMPLGVVQRWDCFGDVVTCTIFDHLEELECVVRCSDGEVRPGSYVMTFDWWGNGFSDTPDQHKCLHLLKLDGGQFALYPNNFVVWREPSFTSEEAVSQLAQLRGNRYVYRAEAQVQEQRGA